MQLSKTTSLFFIAISAMLYSFAFLFSHYCWWVIFLFPFFFLMSSEKNISFYQAFLWNFITYGLAIIGIVYALYLMNISWFFLLFLFFYVSLITAIPFYFMEKLHDFISKRWKFSYYFAVFSNGFSLFSSQIILTEMVLFPCGNIEGYILAHPFILFSNPSFSKILSFYNFEFLTLFFYMSYVFLIIFLKKKNIQSSIPLVITLFFLAVPSFHKQEILSHPSWLKKVGVLPLFFPNPHDINYIFAYINDKISVNLKDNPQLDLILLPEGSIDCSIDAKQINYIVKNYDAISKINLVFGTSCWNKNYLHNSCFILKKGKVEEIYHKRHAMPLTERNIIFSSSLTQKIITPSNNPHPLIEFEDFSLVPYICSELFLNPVADDNYNDFPIVAFCSDIWFFGIGSYIKELMVKTAQLKAILWQRPILYISYSNSYFIEKNGKKVKLQNLI